MAEVVQPFLAELQCEAPLSPSLYETIKKLHSTLLRFVKDNVLKDASSAVNVVVNNPNNLKCSTEVDIGYSVRAALKKSKSSNSENFYKSCRMAFQKFSQKLIEQSPLKYKLTGAISCLDSQVAMNWNIAVERMSICLDVLVSNRWIPGNIADKVDFQYIQILKKPVVINLLKSYSRSTHLDHFWSNIMNSNHGFHELKKKAGKHTMQKNICFCGSASYWICDTYLYIY